MVLKQRSGKSVERHSESGFSLIEVAIALIVISLLMTPIIQTYNIYIEQKKIAITQGVNSIVRAALLKHYQKYGHYPPPADPSIAQGSPHFGAPVSLTSVISTCTATATTVCKSTTGWGSNEVLIGDVPFAALGIPYKSMMDGYGNKLKYAVTKSLADPASIFDDTQGAIEIRGSDGASIYPNASTPRAHFAVVSLGENGLGAFTIAGAQTAPCGTGTIEEINCQNSGTFRSNIDVGGTGRAVISNGNGPSYFDDYVVATNTTSYGVWSYIPNSGLNIEARNGGNIRIGPRCAGTCVPSSHIEVFGNVKASKVHTTRFCASGQASCFDEKAVGTPLPDPPPRRTAGALGDVGFFSPTMLTIAPVARPTDLATYPDYSQGGVEGAGIRCYDNHPLKGIRSYDEVCATGATSSGMLTSPRIWEPTTITGVTSCPGTQYAVGIIINADGDKFSLKCM